MASTTAAAATTTTTPTAAAATTTTTTTKTFKPNKLVLVKRNQIRVIRKSTQTKHNITNLSTYQKSTFNKSLQVR